MAQWVKAMAAKVDDLNSIPEHSERRALALWVTFYVKDKRQCSSQCHEYGFSFGNQPEFCTLGALIL